jgi:hypothetical protein
MGAISGVSYGERDGVLPGRGSATKIRNLRTEQTEIYRNILSKEFQIFTEIKKITQKHINF